ncbi:unnamed protein product [Soboliphyme baturini]|uniref:Uncharacterized protein n=1 Tax=Soboliphyme baturini TaxID=241478 RepID=A0A183J7H2_9BILA|nr:unnamed protein product [Soboliphyme baturini]
MSSPCLRPQFRTGGDSFGDWHFRRRSSSAVVVLHASGWQRAMSRLWSPVFRSLPQSPSSLRALGNPGDVRAGKILACVNTMSGGWQTFTETSPLSPTLLLSQQGFWPATLELDEFVVKIRFQNISKHCCQLITEIISIANQLYGIEYQFPAFIVIPT